MPPPFEEWWRGIMCYLVRAFVRACVRPCVRPLSNLVIIYQHTKFDNGRTHGNTGQVRFGLQSTNFLRSYGPFIKT